ncbi:MAG: hypothetical protein AAFX81_14385 [Pseudomonadota bacterium]
MATGLAPLLRAQLLARMPRGDLDQRVQLSVFACEVEPARRTASKARLVGESDPEQD